MDLLYVIPPTLLVWCFAVMLENMFKDPTYARLSLSFKKKFFMIIVIFSWIVLSFFFTKLVYHALFGNGMAKDLYLISSLLEILVGIFVYIITACCSTWWYFNVLTQTGSSIFNVESIQSGS
jgi:hypothetical protein